MKLKSLRKLLAPSPSPLVLHEHEWGMWGWGHPLASPVNVLGVRSCINTFLS